MSFDICVWSLFKKALFIFNKCFIMYQGLVNLLLKPIAVFCCQIISEDIV